MLLAAPNQAIPLSVLAADGAVSLYPQARIYDSSGNLVTTLNLALVAEGLYSVTYTPTTEGIYEVVYEFYTDSSRTQPGPYDKGSETLDVNSERSNILRLLGLAHHNAIFDQQTYNPAGMLLSGRLRAYVSAAAAALASNVGLLFQWNIVAVYNANNQLVNFQIQQVT